MLMKRIFAWLLFLMVMNTLPLTAQNLTGAYELAGIWYVDDSLLHFDAPPEGLRTMHYLDLFATKGRWEAAVRAEYFLPAAWIGYNPHLQGAMLTGYLQYTNEPWQIKAGNIYDQLGSGMIFRAWSDRSMGIDNALRGIALQYDGWAHTRLKFFTGNPRTGMYFNDDVWITAAGISHELSLDNQTGLRIDAGILSRYYPPENTTLPDRVNLYGLQVAFNRNRWDISFEYDYKTPDALWAHGILNDRVLFDGDAYTFNIGYARKGLGWNFTWRRLENVRLYALRSLQGNVYNEGLLNFVPVLVKQHDYPLATIYVYAGKQAISWDDLTVGEIGGQTDLIYKIPRKTRLGGRYGTILSFNWARWHALQATFYPELGIYRRPFWGAGPLYYQDINLTVKHKFTRKTKALLFLMHQTYNQALLEGHGETVKALTVEGDITRRLLPRTSLRLQAGHLWTAQDRKNWAEATAELNFMGRWGFFVSDLYNYGSTGIHYYTAGFNHTKGGNRLQLSYGRQKGGLVCTGGICRYIPPYKGLQMSLSLRLD